MGELTEAAEAILKELAHVQAARDACLAAPLEGLAVINDAHDDILRQVAQQNRLFAEEPFIGYCKALRDNQPWTFFIVRNATPTGIRPSSERVQYVSYKAPLGAIMDAEVGEDFAIAVPAGEHVYEPVLKDAFRLERAPDWDAVDNLFHHAAGQTHLRSLAGYLASLPRPSAAAPLPTDAATVSSPAVAPPLIGAILLEEADEAIAPLHAMQRAVREQFSLRDQPMLDKSQSALFRLPLQGVTILSGAPGAGKTTVLLRRVAQKAEYAYLSEEDRENVPKALFDQMRAARRLWVIYTPNELLREYLREAMGKEGLPATAETVKAWEHERERLSREVFRLLKFGPSQQGLVLDPRCRAVVLRSGREQLRYAGAFETFHCRRLKEQEKTVVDEIRHFRDTLQRIVQSDTALANMQQALFSREAGDDARGLLGWLLRRARTVAAKCNAARPKGWKGVAKRVVAYARLHVDSRQELLNARALAARGAYGLLREVPLPAEVAEACRRAFDQPFADQKSRDKAWHEATRRMLEFWHPRKGDMACAMPECLQQLPVASRTTCRHLGEVLRGADMLLRWLREQGQLDAIVDALPRSYAQFRRAMCKKYPDFKGQEELTHCIGPEELDVLLHAALQICSEADIRWKGAVAEGGGRAERLAAFRASRWLHVAVDEVTDFSPLQLACMAALTHPVARALSLAGDPMQRVTALGLERWEDLAQVGLAAEPRHLERVYRQSATLRAAAEALQRQASGVPVAEAVAPSTSEDPPILSYQYPSSEALATWLANRIEEIHACHGRLPSIAILAPSEERLGPLFALLEHPLKMAGIQVECCREGRVLGQQSRVRLFSAPYIKGLEFEAVFFIDIDQVAKEHVALADKFFYVGLTRACSFLGVATQGRLPARLRCLRPYLASRAWRCDSTAASRMA